MNKIEKGSTVKYNGGYYKVSRCGKTSVNLSGIFPQRRRDVRFFSVPIGDVVEAYDEWEKYWHQSEAYQAM